MNNSLLIKLSELVEHSSQASKHLIQSEVCLNDGDLAQSQKHTMHAIDMLKTMVGDVFVEVLEELEIDSDEVCSDLDPNSLNLAYALCDISYNGGVLLNMLVSQEEDRVISIVKTKIMHAINDAKNLFETLYM